MLVLSGIAVIALGFLLRLHPLPVIVAAALAAGLAAGLDPLAVLRQLGHAFNATRYVSAVYLVLPVIGLLERAGLQARARSLVEAMRGATVGRLLAGYLLFRQVTSAIGLQAMGGHAQTVRPLVAPMAEAAAERQGSPDPERIRALAAATDNVGVFFGEDVFIAIGSILLMKGVLQGFGVAVEPFRLSLWAMPTALAAFVIHGGRLWWLDRRLARAAR
jgi:uncharacterized membrane protein